MSLSNEERNTLVALELKKAREAYEDIGILIASNRLNGAANRMYYAVFHAVNGCLSTMATTSIPTKAHMPCSVCTT